MSNKINKENYDLLIRVLCSNLAYNLKIKTPNGIEKNKVVKLSSIISSWMASAWHMLLTISSIE